MGVLDEIVGHKRSEVAALKARRPLADLVAACRGLPPGLDFEAALRPAGGERVRLIAEVKRGSPSRGLFRADLDPVAQATIYAGAGAA
ncbi:MAG TPA: indole-3-glycerol phosphate synthase, partial [Methylomirabilota bacterium]|nr:indole-3-glycerol phosphate synthase [Methylomirabilota bacterium]